MLFYAPRKRSQLFSYKFIYCVFNRVQSVHKGVPKNGAIRFLPYRRKPALGASLAEPHKREAGIYVARRSIAIVKKPAKTARDAGFAAPHIPGRAQTGHPQTAGGN